MNKQELVKAMAAKAELSNVNAEKALNAFVEVVKEALAAKDAVQLVGFGTFKVEERAARTGRNPRTGQELKIAAKKVAKFKPGKALEDKLK